MSNKGYDQFSQTLWAYYDEHGRDLPWRASEPSGKFDPYKIFVSELMLQQTQVARVIPKYQEFIARFPDVRSLAMANLEDVLKLWSGLGYNRRAKFLHSASKMVLEHFGGILPETIDDLMKLPGVGKNTAGAIAAYAFNQPALFIETNVRTVLIHHFFADDSNVPDKEISEVMEHVIDKENPREFYWALMDYGTNLKATLGNLNVKSKHYVKQSKFEGSLRQIRGQILKCLSGEPHTFAQLMNEIGDTRLHQALDDLVRESLISFREETYHLG